MEKNLEENILVLEYVINCIAKFEDKINQLAYKEKQYRYTDSSNDYKQKLEELIAYRKPFIDFLMRDADMPLEDIKEAVSNVKEKNIPTKAVCDQIRAMIVSGSYWIEQWAQGAICFVPALPTQNRH